MDDSTFGIGMFWCSFVLFSIISTGKNLRKQIDDDFEIGKARSLERVNILRRTIVQNNERTIALLNQLDTNLNQLDTNNKNLKTIVTNLGR